MKKFSLFVFIVFIVAVGYATYSILKPEKTVPHDFGTVATSTPIQPLSFDTQRITDENKQYTYSVSAEYPLMKGGTTTITDNINKEIQFKVNDVIGHYKKDAQDQFQEVPDAVKATDNKSFLEIKYQVQQDLIDKGILSISFPQLYYMLAAAHPGHSAFTLNFDLRTGSVVTLKDTFIGDYVNEISQAAVQKLQDKLGDLSTLDQIKEGAGPKEENFKEFYFAADGMHILFDDYQVAPYAAGPQEVVLDYDYLQPIINPNGILGTLKK